jgi:hypothetical protein
MAKTLAVLRTAFLVFIAGYTLRAMPFVTSPARTFDEQYAVCSASLHLLVRAAWIAIAWIAFETVVGWIAVSWRGRRARRAATTATPTRTATPAPTTTAAPSSPTSTSTGTSTQPPTRDPDPDRFPR